MSETPTTPRSGRPFTYAECTEKIFAPTAERTFSAGVTPSQKAAVEWIGRNWTEGFKFAGADANYVAFWAFVAGAEYAALKPEIDPDPAAEFVRFQTGDAP